jgi:hypothetical protein
MGNAPGGNASEYWFEPNFNCMVTIFKELLEKLTILYPNFGILLCCTLLLFSVWFFHSQSESPYLSIKLLFPIISTAIYFDFSFSFLSDERLVLLIAWYTGFFCLVYYKEEKNFSFFLLFSAMYLLYLYSVVYVSLPLTLISYIFHFSLFFLYHWYYTFTRRFFLRVYSVVKVFFFSYSLVRLTLWVLFVLLPTLIDNFVCLTLVLYPLLVLSLLHNNITILFFLTLFSLWHSFFLFILNRLKLFPKAKEKIVKYFSRRACLHFIENNR